MSIKRCQQALDKMFPTKSERIQKLLARAGYGSRRQSEELITSGRVRVDGVVIRELGSKASLSEQEVLVDGRPITPEEPVYYVLHKPKNVLCTVNDPLGRRTVLDFFPNETRRIFPVGRLDLDSRGAVILTNDGRLTQLLTHPRYGIERTYHVRVRGEVDDYTLKLLRSGIRLSEGTTSPAHVWVLKRRPEETELGITIHEGRNRQVRRMFAAVSHKVRGLTRQRIGAVNLKGLALSEARRLEAKEIVTLIAQAREYVAKPAPPRSRDDGGRRPRHGKPDPKLAHELYKQRSERDARVAQRVSESLGEEEVDAAVEAPWGRRSAATPREAQQGRRDRPSPRRSSDGEGRRGHSDRGRPGEGRRGGAHGGEGRRGRGADRDGPQRGGEGRRGRGADRDGPQRGGEGRRGRGRNSAEGGRRGRGRGESAAEGSPRRGHGGPNKEGPSRGRSHNKGQRRR